VDAISLENGKENARKIAWIIIFFKVITVALKIMKIKNGDGRGEKERCSGSYCQAVGFLVIKDDSISERPG